MSLYLYEVFVHAQAVSWLTSTSLFCICKCIEVLMGKVFTIPLFWKAEEDGFCRFFFLIFVKLLNIFGSQLIFLKRNGIESRHAHTSPLKLLVLHWAADCTGNFQLSLLLILLEECHPGWHCHPCTMVAYSFWSDQSKGCHLPSQYYYSLQYLKFSLEAALSNAALYSFCSQMFLNTGLIWLQMAPLRDEFPVAFPDL